MKKKLSTNLLLYPCPVTLVTTKSGSIENVLTVSWTGIASSNPEYVTISIKPQRYSYHLIKESVEFGINIPNKDLIREVDFCGSNSGEIVDKFAKCKFTKINGECINPPLIKECPVNIECKVFECISLGGHDIFIAKVLNKLIDRTIDDKQINEQLEPVVYFRPNYYSVAKEKLGYYGYTKD